MRADKAEGRAFAAVSSAAAAAASAAAASAGRSPAYAVGPASVRPSEAVVCSRILYFWILPVTVIGNSSTNTT